MRCLAVLLCCFVLVACKDGATSPTVPLNEEFTLAPGSIVSIATRDLTVRFVEVQGDSRCPADALCITGGDAIVKVEARSRSSSMKAYDLHTGSMRPVVHDGLTIVLVQLAPYPFSSRTIDPKDYRATLRVTD